VKYSMDGFVTPAAKVTLGISLLNLIRLKKPQSAQWEII
jgi:hypothetical protein